MVHWPGGLSRQNNIAALCILIWVGECLPKHILVDVGRHQATLAVPMHLPVWNHHWECQPPGEITVDTGAASTGVGGRRGADVQQMQASFSESFVNIVCETEFRNCSAILFSGKAFPCWREQSERVRKVATKVVTPLTLLSERQLFDWAKKGTT